jgi:dynein heavy chain 1
VRKSLDEIINELKQLPAKVRSYACVENMQELLSKFLNLQPILRDLCTDALKDRHWKIILQGLNIRTFLSELTVGIVWDCSPMGQKKLIQDVLSTAQGELAIEQFLRDLKEQWTDSELTLIMRDGVRLISGWDVLFTSLEDNLNSLASLKQSPYFRNVSEFQEATTLWESKLTALRGIFDVWVEVQRKWVYLRGIFKNPDIKAQLPSQFSKFKQVDTDFLALMKRVSTKPTVLDLLQVDNLFKTLERQETTMSVIQKALGEYLEKQRQIFAVCYNFRCGTSCKPVLACFVEILLRE